ncbi:MAG: ATP-binding protein [Myxococcales bacterium]
MGRLGARMLARLAGAAVMAVAAADAADEKTVVTIYAETRLNPVIAILDDTIQSTLQSRSANPIRFDIEYLDLSWFGGPGGEDLHARVLREKYAGRKLDVVIVCGEAAIAFVLRERAALFPGVPIVFCLADYETIDATTLEPDVTGVTMLMDWTGAVDLVLGLHPATKRVAFVGGSGPTAYRWERNARRKFAKFGNRVEFVYLTGLPMAELLKSVAGLPDGTVGLFNVFLRDSAGRTFTTSEALELVSRASSVPMYGMSESMFGYGIVGGPIIDLAGQGRAAAELARRILVGERLGPADIVAQHANPYLFDARQLERWRIAEDKLPPDSVVRFRQLPTWYLYRRQILLAAALVALQTLLIASLLLERRQRKRAERRLDERLRFETLISDLAATFLEIGAVEVDRKMDHALRRIVEELRVDRASIIEFSGGELRVTHSSRQKEVAYLPAVLDVAGLPWIAQRLCRGEVVSWSRPDELPPEAAIDRKTIASLGVKSLVLLPFVLGKSEGGVLACSLLRDERKWDDELVARLHLLAEIFAMVMLRRRTQTALVESERRFRVMADAAPVMIWMAGPDGGRIDFNRRWVEFTGRALEEERGDGWFEGVHPTDRDSCKDAYREALRARSPFTIEYRLRRADGSYRSVLDCGVPRFDGDAAFRGYVGSAIDITEAKAAHEDAERGREELGHALRVATLGELTATLAHEINQPLTGIFSTAQGMRRVLEAGEPTRIELREAFQDVASNARRASEIVGRVRTLFRKELPGRRPLDVNDAIVVVTGLLRKELERKRVALQLTLASELPPVLGDAVQLQQVLLNIVVNACDAMERIEGIPRELRIETARTGPERISIIFRDSGIGVRDGDVSRIFDRFVTTKRDGLGMGLSISRSIIEAHGGRIWATRNPDRGLTIHGELPCLPS